MALIKIEGNAKFTSKTIFGSVSETPAFTPTNISGLQLWLDASDTSTLYNATAGGSLVTTDGSAIARWQDKSGNLRHFIQGVANSQPTLVASGKNNKNTISFDGANDILNLANNNLLRNIPAYTCFFVRKNKTSVTGTQETNFVSIVGGSVIFDFNTQATNRPGLRARRLTANTLTSLQGSNSQTTAGTFELWGTLIDHSVTTATLFKNGTQLATNTAFLTSGNSQDTVRTSSIGAFATTSNQSDIEVAEILIYHSALTTTDRQQVETYLNNKWALY